MYTTRAGGITHTWYIIASLYHSSERRFATKYLSKGYQKGDKNKKKKLQCWINLYDSKRNYWFLINNYTIQNHDNHFENATKRHGIKHRNIWWNLGNSLPLTCLARWNISNHSHIKNLAFKSEKLYFKQSEIYRCYLEVIFMQFLPKRWSHIYFSKKTNIKMWDILNYTTL